MLCNGYDDVVELKSGELADCAMSGVRRCA